MKKPRFRDLPKGQHLSPPDACAAYIRSFVLPSTSREYERDIFEEIAAYLDEVQALVVELEQVKAAAVKLYRAGRWSAPQVSDVDAAVMWTALRDALGVPDGTATALGVAADAALVARAPQPCTFVSREGVAACALHGPLEHGKDGWRCSQGGTWIQFGAPFDSPMGVSRAPQQEPGALWEPCWVLVGNDIRCRSCGAPQGPHRADCKDGDDPPVAAAPLPASAALQLIAAERDRQVSREDYSAKHDDSHADGEIACAAACYALPESHRRYSRRHHELSENGGRDLVWWTPTHWPDGWEFKASPKDRVRELVKAGALIAAEIDRLLRAESQKTEVRSL
jgi:hypothetical protein